MVDRHHHSRSCRCRSCSRSPKAYRSRRSRSPESSRSRRSRSRSGSPLPLTFPLEFQNRIDFLPERCTRLYVSNLGDGVSNDDIFKLFSYIGSLSSSTLKYDKIGRSTGIAEVVFNSHSDAMRAVRKCRNLTLDGRPIKIKVVEF